MAPKQEQTDLTAEIERLRVKLAAKDKEILRLRTRLDHSQIDQKASDFLQRQNHQLNAILDNVPVGITLKDLLGRYTYVNKYVARRRKTGVAAFIGKTSYEVYGTELAREFDEITERVIRLGNAAEDLERTTSARGSHATLTSIFPVFDESGNVAAVVSTHRNVTKVREGQDELTSANKMLQTVLDHLPIGVSLKNRDGHTAFANKRVLRAKGIPLSEMAGKNDFETYQNEDARALDYKIKEVFQTAIPVLNHERRGFANPEKEYLTDMIPVAGDDGEVEHVVVTSVDVTKQKRIAARVREQNEFFHAVLDLIPAVISVRGADLRYKFVNKTFIDLRPKNSPSLIGQTMKEAFGDRYDDALDKLILNVIETRQPVLNHKRKSYGRRQGARVTNILPMPVAVDGERDALVVNIDVSAMQRAQDEITRQKETLQVLIDNVPAGISLRDSKGRYVVVNKMLAETRGEPPEFFIGKTSRQVYGGSLNTVFAENSKKVLESGEPVLDFEREGRKEGSTYSLQSIVPIKDVTGAVESIVTVTTDISDRKRAEAELQRHRDHLAELVEERTNELQLAQKGLLRSERLAAIGQLTATVSHELRNPLGTIKSSFYSLRGTLEQRDGKSPRIMDRIDRNIERCVHIIEELLSYARVGELRVQSITFDQWCADVVAELEIPNSVELRISCEADIELSLDADRMRQVLVNLVQNAWQAVFEHWGDNEGGCVELKVQRSGGRLLIQVADNGPGVPDSQKSAVFDPLVSTKVYGIGLGLPLVRQIIELHGGTITVEDHEAGGAVFVIDMPIRQAATTGLLNSASAR